MEATDWSVATVWITLKKRLIAQPNRSPNTSKKCPGGMIALRKTSRDDFNKLRKEIQRKLQADCDKYKGPRLRGTAETKKSLKKKLQMGKGLCGDERNMYCIYAYIGKFDVAGGMHAIYVNISVVHH